MRLEITRAVVACVLATLMFGCRAISTEMPVRSTPSTTPTAADAGLASLCDGHDLVSVQTAALPRRITAMLPRSAHANDEITVSFEGFPSDVSVEAVVSTLGDVPWPPVATTRSDASGGGSIRFTLRSDAPQIDVIREMRLPCLNIVIRPADTFGVYVGPNGEPHYAIARLRFQY